MKKNDIVIEKYHIFVEKGQAFIEKGDVLTENVGAFSVKLDFFFFNRKIMVSL